MDKISRDDARKFGLKRFFTEIPCIRGHVAARYVSVGSCVECHHGYFNEWKTKNPEKLLEISRATGAKNRVRRAAERDANREARREKGRQLYANNKAGSKERTRKWLAKNPNQKKTQSSNYRARKINAPGKYSPRDIENLCAAQNGKCAMPWCRTILRRKYHVDHIISLFAGGSNYPSNLQLLCPTCNWRKSKKDPVQFAKENGFLL